jgi:hypothetical protein
MNYSQNKINSMPHIKITAKTTSCPHIHHTSHRPTSQPLSNPTVTHTHFHSQSASLRIFTDTSYSNISLCCGSFAGILGINLSFLTSCSRFCTLLNTISAVGSVSCRLKECPGGFCGRSGIFASLSSLCLMCLLIVSTCLQEQGPLCAFASDKDSGRWQLHYLHCHTSCPT